MGMWLLIHAGIVFQSMLVKGAQGDSNLMVPLFLAGLSQSNNTPWHTYRKVSNISGIKFQNLNVSRLVVQLSLPNPMKPVVKSRMKM